MDTNKEINNTENDNNKSNIGKTLFSMFYSNMDKTNQKAADTYFKEGETGFINHVFTDQESNRKLSYAEMRSRYG